MKTKTDVFVMPSIGVVGAAVACVCFAGLAGQAAPPAEKLATLTVAAGKHDRIDTPVCVELKGLGKVPQRVALAELDRRAARDVQVVPGKPAKLWFFVTGKMPAGTKRTYQLYPAPAGGMSIIRVHKDDEKIELVRGEAKIFRYNIKAPSAPKGVDRIFERAAYIHPLWSVGPDGPQRVLTHDFPSDHYHHHGIWFPWTNTTFEGAHVDFWNLGKRQGTVRLKKVLATTEGPIFSGFRTAHEFVVKKAVLAKGPDGKPTKTGEKVALDETWDVRVYNLPGRSGAGMRLWDIVSTQTCGTDSPLIIHKYRYGGMGYRAAKEWTGPNALHLTSEGNQRRKSDATRPRWTVVSGAIDGQWDSVTLMSHPKNINHPEPVRTWANPRQPTFFGFAPVRASGWVFQPGKQYVFRYRFCVTLGKPDAKLAERLWQDFADPPAVAIAR